MKGSEMDEIQISKNGNKFIPNSFQTPNFFVDELMAYLTPEENCCLFYAIRHILGFQDKIVERKARIAISSFQRAGLGQTATRTALRGLHQYKILMVDGEPNMKGQMLKLQEDDKLIDWNGLKKRKGEKEATNVARTSTARLHNPNITGSPAVLPPLSDNTNPPLSDNNIKTQVKTQADGEAKASLPEGKEKVETPVVSDSLIPSTPGGLYLFEKLGSEARAKKHNGPVYFTSLEQRDKFLEHEKRLGLDCLKQAISAALVKGLTSRDGVVNYIAKWTPEKYGFGKNGNGGSPPVAKNGNGKEYPACLTTQDDKYRYEEKIGYLQLNHPGRATWFTCLAWLREKGISDAWLVGHGVKEDYLKIKQERENSR